MTTRKKDYYEALGINRNASEEDIRKAFRRLAMEYHPDRNHAPGAEARFKEINEAYQILSDAQKRAQYDRYGHAGVGAQAGTGRGFEGFDNFGGFGDIFDAFFGGSSRATTAPRKGDDLLQSLKITFEEAIFGTEKNISISRMEECQRCNGKGSEPGTKMGTCDNCRGSGRIKRSQQSLFGQFATVVTCSSCKGHGKINQSPCTQCKGVAREKRNRKLAVKIPAGVDNGSHIRLSTEGGTGYYGGPSGDLYIEISVQPHKIFRRDGDNILLEVPIDFPSAALGDVVEIPTMQGTEHLNIPQGIQSGTIIRIKGKGAPNPRTRKYGDQLIKIKIVTPKSPNSNQKELLEQLQKSFKDGTDGEGAHKSWFNKIKDVLN